MLPVCRTMGWIGQPVAMWQPLMRYTPEAKATTGTSYAREAGTLPVVPLVCKTCSYVCRFAIHHLMEPDDHGE
jgi:hypothetical protein